jgi:hypothetical protein
MGAPIAPVPPRMKTRNTVLPMQNLRAPAAICNPGHIPQRNLPNAKIVSIENDLKNVFLNSFPLDRDAWHALLTRTGCDSI